MAQHDINIRIFGLSGDTIADYSHAAIECATCKAKPGYLCDGMAANRCHPARFKAAINQLDAAGEKAILKELARADEPTPVGKHIGEYANCRYCTELFGKQFSMAAHQAHVDGLIEVTEGKHITTTRLGGRK